MGAPRLKLSVEERRLRRNLDARRWRTNHPDKHIEIQLRANKKRRDAWQAFLWFEKGKPCLDCGGKFPPECMDFDHVRGIKKCGVGHFHCDSPAAREEIAKCELVCANCHRIRTTIRKQRAA